MSIKVAIADDHQLIIQSLEEVFRSTGYMEVVGTFSLGEHLLSALPDINPDVLILDYHLPDKNGTQLARYITYHFPEVKIIALTGFDKPGLATEMLENGCAGFLLKTSTSAEIIVEAVNTVYDGKIYMDSALKGKFSASIQESTKKNHQEHPKLTNRELEVLEKIAAGLSSQEIGEELFISKRTVDNHRISLLLKTGTKNTAGLIRFAIEMKLI